VGEDISRLTDGRVWNVGHGSMVRWWWSATHHDHRTPAEQKEKIIFLNFFVWTR